jgi:D-alanyl-D-alanine carboxypeptidase
VILGFKPASAERASLVFNPDTGTVLHAHNARLKSFPASLTKLMTLYLLFEALDSKKINLGDKAVVSAAAQGQPPSRLGLKKGWQITIEEILLALIVKSANDAAVVAAEQLADSEADFVKMMNARARTLGLSDTSFGNASGLPNRRQITTALDMAILIQKLMNQYQQYYPFLLKRSFTYRGKTFARQNGFVSSSDNIYKLKTGFTCHSGYNLVASVERGRQKLVGVFFGARNVDQRNAAMMKRFNQAFSRPKSNQPALSLGNFKHRAGQGSDGALNSKAIAESCLVGAPTDKYDQITGWGLLVGVDKTADLALNLATKTTRRFPKLLNDAKPAAIPLLKKVLLYRSYLTGLNEAAAVDACRHMRQRGYYCVAETPETLRIRIREGRIAFRKAQDLRSDK